MKQYFVIDYANEFSHEFYQWICLVCSFVYDKKKQCSIDHSFLLFVQMKATCRKCSYIHVCTYYEITHADKCKLEHLSNWNNCIHIVCDMQFYI